jgi:translocation protein SEC62
LIEHGLVLRLDRKPELPSDDPEKKGQRKKWPKEVMLSPKQVFEEKAFFQWTFAQESSSIWGWLIVAAVLFILLFPIWPMVLKVGVFYLSLYLLIFLVP